MLKFPQKLLTRTVFAALWALTVLLPSTALAADPPTIYWADRLVNELPSPSDLNTYATPYTVTWAGVNGATQTKNASQCAPLVTAVLKQAYNWTDDQIKGYFGSKSPSAASYHDL